MDTSELEIRVRYAETDQMGVAHHASYLVWFEAGRTEFIRGRGRSYAEIEADGWLLVVVEARCRYLRPARYDDLLVLRTRLGPAGRATLAFDYELVRKEDGEMLARGTTVHAAVDRTGRPRRIPEEVRRLLGLSPLVRAPRSFQSPRRPESASGGMSSPSAGGPASRPRAGEPGHPAN